MDLIVRPAGSPLQYAKYGPVPPGVLAPLRAVKTVRPQKKGNPKRKPDVRLPPGPARLENAKLPELSSASPLSTVRVTLALLPFEAELVTDNVWLELGQ